MANEDQNSTHRSHEFAGPPDGYIRRESIFKAVGAAVGILGAVLGLIGLNNAYRDYVDRLLSNERVERINQDKELQRQILDYIARGRR